MASADLQLLFVPAQKSPTQEITSQVNSTQGYTGKQQSNNFFLRKDGKSFATISIRRRKGKKKASVRKFKKTGPKNYTTEESVSLILYNFDITTEQLSKLTPLTCSNLVETAQLKTLLTTNKGRKKHHGITKQQSLGHHHGQTARSNRGSEKPSNASKEETTLKASTR